MLTPCQRRVHAQRRHPLSGSTSSACAERISKRPRAIGWTGNRMWYRRTGANGSTRVPSDPVLLRAKLHGVRLLTTVGRSAAAPPCRREAGGLTSAAWTGGHVAPGPQAAPAARRATSANSNVSGNAAPTRGLTGPGAVGWPARLPSVPGLSLDSDQRARSSGGDHDVRN
jgi:hypothetical protein